MKYSIFRRLEMFALKTMLISDSDEAVKYLLENNGVYIWDIDSKREVLNLLGSLTDEINSQKKENLENIIISGDDADSEPTDSDKYHIWLRLRKLRNILASESPASIRLQELDKQFSKYKNDESIEFNTYIEVGYFEDEVKVPMTFEDLTVWLIDECDSERHRRTNWGECCKENFYVSVDALVNVSTLGKWPISQWNDALIYWSDKQYALRAWEKISHTLLSMPQDVFTRLGLQISIFLDSLAKEIEIDNSEQVNSFFKLCDATIRIVYPFERNGKNLINSAINHPIGVVTQAVLRYWGRCSLSDNIGLAPKVAEFLKIVLESEREQDFYGKLIIATRAINIFRVDACWFRKNILQFFDWKNSIDIAKCMWSGFLWNPYVYAEFLSEISDYFLKTANRLEDIDISGQYVRYLTYISLESKEIFGIERIRRAFDCIPEKFLHESIHEIEGAFKNSHIPYCDYWRNRVTPFVCTIWPKDTERNTQKILGRIALLCIHAKDAFPVAFNDFRLILKHFYPEEHFLSTVEYDPTIMECVPECLEFFRTICKNGNKYYYLDKFLENLASKDSSIRERDTFRQLCELVYT